MRFSLVVLIVVATSGMAAATPWDERCKARLAKAAPTLGPIGKATIAIALSRLGRLL